MSSHTFLTLLPPPSSSYPLTPLSNSIYLSDFASLHHCIIHPSTPSLHTLTKPTSETENNETLLITNQLYVSSSSYISTRYITPLSTPSLHTLTRPTPETENKVSSFVLLLLHLLLPPPASSPRSLSLSHSLASRHRTQPVVSRG